MTERHILDRARSTGRNSTRLSLQPSNNGNGIGIKQCSSHRKPTAEDLQLRRRSSHVISGNGLALFSVSFRSEALQQFLLKRTPASKIDRGGAGMMGSTSPKVFETGKSKRCTGDMVLRRLSITNAPQQGELQKDKPGPWIFRHSNMSKKHLNPNLTWVHAHIHAPSPRFRNTPSYICRLIPPISTSQLTDSAMSPPFTGRVARQISTICTASS